MQLNESYDVCSFRHHSFELCTYLFLVLNFLVLWKASQDSNAWVGVGKLFTLYDADQKKLDYLNIQLGLEK